MERWFPSVTRGWSEIRSPGTQEPLRPRRKRYDSSDDPSVTVRRSLARELSRAFCRSGSLEEKSSLCASGWTHSAAA